MNDRWAYLEVQNGAHAGLCRTLETGDTVTIGRGGRCTWSLPDAPSLFPQQASVCWDGARLHVFESAMSWANRPTGPSPTWTVKPGGELAFGGVRMAVWADGPERFEIPGQVAPLERLRSYLASRQENVFFVIDAAGDKRTRSWLSRLPLPHMSLFQGEKQREHGDNAPYLLQVDPHHDSIDAVLRFLWGRSMLSILLDDRDFDAVRRHLRHFLLVFDPEGRTVYFRFYDPRILRAFLPTCSLEQAQQFFGYCRAWITEAPRPASFLVFEFRDSALTIRTNSLVQRRLET